MLARNHAIYVIRITKNQKVFDPAYNDAVTSDIVNEAKTIFRCIFSANEIVVNGTKSYTARRELQETAARTCNDLLADIAIARTVFNLRGKRMKYWTAMVIEIRNRTRKWIKTDADRYRMYR